MSRVLWSFIPGEVHPAGQKATDVKLAARSVGERTYTGYQLIPIQYGDWAYIS